MTRKSPNLELIPRILDRISLGSSVRKACEAEGMAINTFRENVDSEQYARARSLCADVHFDELDNLADQVKAGEIDANAARVAADITKWRVARMKPWAYSDKMQVETIQGADISSMTDEQLQTILAVGVK